MHLGVNEPAESIFVRGIELQHGLICGNGVVEALEFFQQQTALVRRVGLAGRDGCRLFVARKGVIATIKALKRCAAVVEGFWIVLADRDRLIECLQCVFEAPKLEEYSALVVERAEMTRLDFQRSVEAAKDRKSV